MMPGWPHRYKVSDIVPRVGAVLVLALAAGACDSASPTSLVPTSPTLPTPVRLPVVQASFSPVPLEAKPQAGGAGAVTYEISATVTLRETAGVSAHLDSIDVTFLSPTGFSSSQRFDVSVDLAELSTATVPLIQVFEAATPIDSGVWRLAGAGRSGDGEAFSLASAEVPVVVRPVSAPAPPPVVAPDVTIAGAGDIAVCGSPGTEATARLLDRMPGTVFTLGDNVYPVATSQNFQRCYEPSWGRHKSRTRPAPGNHDWEEADTGVSYFTYFGVNAGPPGLGYYSFDLGAWHIVSLNSSVPSGAGSAQLEWLRADLAANSSACTLAYWHLPLFSSGPNGGSGHVRDIWRLLYERGADVVMNGHDHNYERFAPQDPDGRATARGIRAFIAGTGGAPLYWRRSYTPNSEVYENGTWGVLKLTLKSLGYDWEFVPAAGSGFRDAGSGTCVY
ncbi:MAG: metallophosphoesterase [Acidobacteria bacterium]|nr:metallophosphoesterase [Acidobacteriota bacterium]